MDETVRTALIIKKTSLIQDIKELKHDLMIDGLLLEKLGKALQDEPETLFKSFWFNRRWEPRTFDAKFHDWLSAPTIQEHIAKVELLRAKIEELEKTVSLLGA